MFVPGYAVTAYASQRKTVDTVLASYAGDETKPATVNRNQWYVAISHVRKKALVFTADKESLRASIERESARDLALTLQPTPAQKAEIERQIHREHEQRMISLAHERQRLAALQQQQQMRVRHIVPQQVPHYYHEQSAQQQPRGIRL